MEWKRLGLGGESEASQDRSSASHRYQQWSEDDVVDRLDVHAARITVRHVRGEPQRVRRSPSPDLQAERRIAVDLVATGVARTDAREVAGVEIGARELEVAVDRLPAGDRSRAIEDDLVEVGVG